MPTYFTIGDDDERVIAGFCSVEIKDKQGDVVPIEELEKAMYKLMDRGGHIIFGHQNKPIGKILRWEIKDHPETSKKGLWIVAKIHKGYEADDVVWNMIKSGTLKGFSIGGGAGKIEEKIIKENGKERPVKYMKDIQLYEVSVVDRPANPLAMIEGVNYFAKGEISDSYIKEDGVWYKMSGDEKIEIGGDEEFVKHVNENKINKVEEILKSIEDIYIDDMRKKLNEAYESLENCSVCKKIFDKLEEELTKSLSEMNYDVSIVPEILSKMKDTVVMLSVFGDDSEKQAMDESDEEEISKEDKCEEKEIEKVREPVKKVLKPKVEINKNEVQKAINEMWDVFVKVNKLDGAVNDLIKKYTEFKKPNDLRPPKAWWDSCMERLNNERLCGWIFYHKLKPTGGGDRETVTARRRKRKWLSSS